MSHPGPPCAPQQLTGVSTCIAETPSLARCASMQCITKQAQCSHTAGWHLVMLSGWRKRVWRTLWFCRSSLGLSCHSPQFLVMCAESQAMLLTTSFAQIHSSSLLSCGSCATLSFEEAFSEQVRMRVWRRDANGSRQPRAFIDVTSKQGAVEVGGGPWWSTWSAQVSCSLAAYTGSVQAKFAQLHVALGPALGVCHALEGFRVGISGSRCPS